MVRTLRGWNPQLGHNRALAFSLYPSLLLKSSLPDWRGLQGKVFQRDFFHLNTSRWVLLPFSTIDFWFFSLSPWTRATMGVGFRNFDFFASLGSILNPNLGFELKSLFKGVSSTPMHHLHRGFPFEFMEFHEPRNFGAFFWFYFRNELGKM